MPNNKNILREKINEACPELLKLEFGCVLHRKNEGKDYGYYQVLEQGSGFRPDFLWVSSRVFGTMQINNDEVGTEEELSEKDITDKFEIIGKPPTLEHLLRTLKEVKDLYSIDSFGQIYKHTEGGEYDTGFIYDLTKPPLEQSEEVIEALLKIINAYIK